MIDHKTKEQRDGGDGNSTRGEKLDSWKEIAAYLRREVRTAQRWEKQEGLPVHRHHHEKLGTVYAFKNELDQWLRQRQPLAPGLVEQVGRGSIEQAETGSVEQIEAATSPQVAQRWSLNSRRLRLVSVCVVLIAVAGFVVVRRVTRGGAPAASRNNSAAMEAYFKGRYAWHKATEGDLQKSLEFFGQARDLDPDFALAHAGIAEAYITLANNGMKRPRDCFPKAQEAVERALALDQSVADTHVAMAQIKCYWDWNWAGAEREFLHALDLGPGLATAHHAYAHFLSEMGRADEALAEVKRAQELEPLSAAINSDAGWFYFRARRYDEAIAECRKVLDLEPGFQSSEACILMSLNKKGMAAEARSEAQRFLAGHNRAGSMPGIDAADPAQAMRNLDLDSIGMMKQMQQTRYVGSYGFASLYADLGDRDNAFKWLETAFQERERVMVVLKVHPLFDPIRDDPRFRDLVRRVGLPSGS